MRAMLDELDATLERVIIHDIKESTFFATLVILFDGIALALRAG